MTFFFKFEECENVWFCSIEALKLKPVLFWVKCTLFMLSYAVKVYISADFCVLQILNVSIHLYSDEHPNGNEI